MAIDPSVLNDITNGSSKSPVPLRAIERETKLCRSKLWVARFPGFEGLGPCHWPRNAELSQDVRVFPQLAINERVERLNARDVVSRDSPPFSWFL